MRETGWEVGSTVNPANLPLAQARADSVVRLSYYLPRHSYWHYCLWAGMTRLDFKVLYVAKLPHHHVWDLRLRTSAKISDKAVRRLRRELRKLCAMHGPSIKARELSIVRNGSLLELAFIWPMGEAGHFNWRSLQAAAIVAEGEVPWGWN